MNIVTFSPAAINQLKISANESEHGHMALRIAAQVTPDETLNYGLGYDDAKEGDAEFDYEGIKVLIDPTSLELLHGTHIDYVEIEPGKFHFIFLNPNDPNYKPPKEDDAFQGV